jgi:uncharacterized integral membrane protein
MLRVLFLLPFLVVLIAFALSNTQPVPLGLWPFDVTVEAPLSIAVLVIAGVFFFLGALIVWFGALAARSRLRAAQRQIAWLEAELKQRPVAATTASAPRTAVAVRA